MPDLYHYSSYWNTWSRVLSGYDFGARGCVEVNLTPIMPSLDGSWSSQVRPIRIRVHSTHHGSHDMFRSELPEDVVTLMVANLGRALTERLLKEDFLPSIDWDKYRAKCNGGANLEDVLKD